MRIWAQLRERIATEGSAVLVSVLSTQGSVPREAGARMIVCRAGICGTIGGGTLEYQAWQRAMSLLDAAAPRAELSKHALGPDLGQCCGGQVVLSFEYFTKSDEALLQQFTQLEKSGLTTQTTFSDQPHALRRVIEKANAHGPVITQGPSEFLEYFDDPSLRVHLFGAGHVGQALVLALAPLPFHIVWHDERRDIFPRLTPANVDIRPLEAAHSIEFFENDFVVIMTHSHPLDLDLVAAALRSKAHFVGLIGSATKRARFMSRLKALGLSQPALSRLVCPLGVPGLEGKEPAIIAASITAQLLLERSKIKGLSVMVADQSDKIERMRVPA